MIVSGSIIIHIHDIHIMHVTVALTLTHSGLNLFHIAFTDMDLL